MPNQKNISQLDVIKQKVEKSKSVIFADYKGLSVNQFNELRSKVRENGGEMLVAKNSLVKIVLKNKDINKALVGPNVAIFAYKDEIAPLKAVAEFNKENNLPVFTAGFFDNKTLTTDDVVKLSQIPGKKELQAKIVGSLAAPLSGMLNVLQGNLSNLVYALKAIQDNKSE